jgi:hypothetical protein
MQDDEREILKGERRGVDNLDEEWGINLACGRCHI